MAKVKTLQPLYKLRVDFYEEDENTGNMHCYCYTPGSTTEKEYLERDLSLAELQEQACDKRGSIRVTYLNDTQDSEDVTFDRWYADNKHTEEMHDALADIINKREGRKEIPDMASIDSLIKKVVSNITVISNAKTA